MNFPDIDDEGKGIYIIVLNEEWKYLEIIPNESVCESKSVSFSDGKEWMAYFPATK